LFTSFAGGWPGFGLLIQRFIVGTMLLHQSATLFRSTTSIAPSISGSIGTVLAIFIMIGLWTPLAGVLVVAFEVCIAFLLPENLENGILFAAVGATLAMIGPGAFSIDSRLFGRKQIGM
jgi:putative oxidoreductase